MIDETDRMSTVLETYLNFTKKKKQERIEFDIQEIIQNVAMMLRTQAGKKNIEIKVMLPEGLERLKGDPNDIWQILMNVLLNSIQAMENGGLIYLRLTEADQINSEKLKLQPAFKECNRFLRISISDEGPGIPNEDIDEIFKPFFTTKEKGSGLGLAIVKRIVDSNNWAIEVQSKKNTGTEFNIFIPLNNDKGRKNEKGIEDVTD